MVDTGSDRFVPVRAADSRLHETTTEGGAIVTKAKIAAVIICLAVAATGSVAGAPAYAGGSGQTLSPSIFPDTLDGLPLIEVAEADRETAFGFDVPIRKGYKAIYRAEGKIIYVNVFLGQSEAAISERVDEIIPESQSAMRDEFEGIEFTSIDRVRVEGYLCPSTSYRVRAMGALIDGRLMLMGVGPYMILVHIMDGVGVPTESDIKSIVERFYERLPETTSPATSTPAATIDPATQALLRKIDGAEAATLTAVLWHVNSIYHTAVQSKIRFGFAVGKVLDKNDVPVGELKTILGSTLWENLDYAYDLDTIHSLRRYCRDDSLTKFEQEYEEHAERKVREEFSFDEAQTRISRGFRHLRDSVIKGELDDRLEELDMVLDEYMRYLEQERVGHVESMAWSQEGSRMVTRCVDVIDDLTGYADRLFGAKLNKVRVVSALSLVWAQNQVRYWTTTAYLWGGTEKLRDNRLERLREQFNLFEREEFHYGPVYAADGGIEELIKEADLDYPQMLGEVR
jgi:hypothetical protein